MIANSCQSIIKKHIIILVLIKNNEVEKIAIKTSVNEQDMFKRAVAMDMLNDRQKAIRYLNEQGILCIESEPEKIDLACVSKYLELKNKLQI